MCPFFYYNFVPMKKILTVAALAMVFASCEKECGCLEPVKAWEETKYHNVLPAPYTTQEYFIKYRDMCGNTKTVEVKKAYYDIWEAMPDICE